MRHQKVNENQHPNPQKQRLESAAHLQYSIPG
jgi:hypothetical protein